MSATPFGETVPKGSLEFNLRFAGQYYDKERGIHWATRIVLVYLYGDNLGRPDSIEVRRIK